MHVRDRESLPTTSNSNIGGPVAEGCETTGIPIGHVGSVQDDGSDREWAINAVCERVPCVIDVGSDTGSGEREAVVDTVFGCIGVVVPFPGYVETGARKVVGTIPGSKWVGS